MVRLEFCVSLKVEGGGDVHAEMKNSLKILVGDLSVFEVVGFSCGDPVNVVSQNLFISINKYFTVLRFCRCEMVKENMQNLLYLRSCIFFEELKHELG